MTKVQKRGVLLLLAGLLLTGAALAIHILQEQQDRMGGESAQVLLQQLQLNSPVILPEATDAEGTPPVKQMPEKEYMGYRMLGSVRVLSVGICMPVLSACDEDMLKIAPCRYSGSIPTADMVITGHNYKSHFTPLHQVCVDDEVIFEDVEGKAYHYRVAAIETLHRNQGELLESEYPLTLVTCTADGIRRLVIRCESVA